MIVQLNGGMDGLRGLTSRCNTPNRFQQVLSRRDPWRVMAWQQTLMDPPEPAVALADCLLETCPIRDRDGVSARVRRETGKEQMVQVHYDEGVAIHIGPESCAGGREAVREALTGECAGQPLSHEKVDIPGADAVRYAEGHTKGRAIASSPTTRRGRRPWHVQTLFVREPGGLVVDQGGMPRLVRIGKARSRSR